MKPENQATPESHYDWWTTLQRKKLWLLAGGAAAAVGMISCATVNRVVVAPPNIPGATFIGSEECSMCHDQIAANFVTATHARLQAPGDNATEAGCESCHGPGSIHSESGGEAGTIVNPKRSPDICFQCHLDKRGQFNLPSHHLVLEGRVSCADCHDPHRGPALAGGTTLMGENELCLRCHQAQRGPFVFEHEAVREGCTTCHEPHGTVNARMLRERSANTCLKCHPLLQQGRNVFIGSMPHLFPAAGFSYLSQGACWSAGCHEAVHGSQVNSSLRF